LRPAPSRSAALMRSQLARERLQSRPSLPETFRLQADLQEQPVTLASQSSVSLTTAMFLWRPKRQLLRAAARSEYSQLPITVTQPSTPDPLPLAAQPLTELSLKPGKVPRQSPPLVTSS